MAEKFERFGKYILLEKIATGGMAEVYLARSSSSSGITKFFALKRILPQYSDNPEFIEMFKAEAKIAINLSHSNIVSIYEFGVEKGQLFLVMDYVEGRNLRQILNKMKKATAKFSIDQIVYIAKEGAAGLDHAHRCLDGSTGRPLNITHRDVSPQNLMISFEGEVKIVDFGIAKAESQLENTKAGTLKGKFGYMSPEQAEGPFVDLRTDVFSLGIVIWELLANERLFIANNEVNTLRKVRECNIPSLRKINPTIPQELEKIVNKALEKDRNLRYQTAGAFHKDLNRFLNRHYPDFSSQDFSVFTKTLFATEILDSRKRLIEYAQITSNEPTSSGTKTDANLEPTVVTQTKTELQTSNSRDSAPQDGDFSRSNMGTTPDIGQPNTRTELDNKKAKVISSEPPREVAAVSPPPKKRPQKPPKGGSEIELEGKQFIRSHKQSQGDPDKNERRNRNIISALQSRQFSFFKILSNSSLILVGSIAIVSYFYLRNHPGERLRLLSAGHELAFAFHDTFVPVYERDSKGVHINHSGSKLETQNQETQNSASKSSSTQLSSSEPSNQTYTVLIQSRPAAAEIFVNGKDTGVLTPGTVDVPANQKFSLNLQYRGYRFYPVNETAHFNGQTFMANLKHEKLGYLNISVLPANATVYLDGKAVNQSPPINRLPVPAGRLLTIRAEIPLTHAWDQVKVSVQQDKVRSIDLFPRTRTPASSR